MGKGKRRSLLLLTEEEARRLATAQTPTRLSRSFLIQEAVQAGLQTADIANVPGRRNKILCFRLPPELRDRVRELAKELDTSQQTLIRHFLFTYLSEMERKSTPPTNRRGKGRRGVVVDA
jgi:hypothetical protein